MVVVVVVVVSAAVGLVAAVAPMIVGAFVVGPTVEITVVEIIAAVAAASLSRLVLPLSRLVLPLWWRPILPLSRLALLLWRRAVILSFSQRYQAVGQALSQPSTLRPPASSAGNTGTPEGVSDCAVTSRSNLTSERCVIMMTSYSMRRQVTLMFLVPLRSSR
jgi:hypothetical protein